LHGFTDAIYRNYIDCFIKKKRRLKEYPFQYKVHMYSLHQIYLHELRIEKTHITMKRVIDYINTLDAGQQMYFINYNINNRCRHASTSGAGTSGAGTSGAGTSGAGTSGAGTV
jgi:hypothetical protein